MLADQRLEGDGDRQLDLRRGRRRGRGDDGRRGRVGRGDRHGLHDLHRRRVRRRGRPSAAAGGAGLGRGDADLCTAVSPARLASAGGAGAAAGLADLVLRSIGLVAVAPGGSASSTVAGLGWLRRLGQSLGLKVDGLGGGHPRRQRRHSRRGLAGLGGDGFEPATAGAATASSTLVSPCLSSPSLVATTKVPPVASARQLRGLRSSALSVKPTTWMRSAGDFSFKRGSGRADIGVAAVAAVGDEDDVEPAWRWRGLGGVAYRRGDGSLTFRLDLSSSLPCVAKVSSPGFARTSLSAQFEALRWPKATSPNDRRSP